MVPGTVLSKVTLTTELSTITDEMVGLEAMCVCVCGCVQMYVCANVHVYMCMCTCTYVQDGEEAVQVSSYGIPPYTHHWSGGPLRLV